MLVRQLNIFSSVCQMENIRMNARQSRKLKVCLRSAEPGERLCSAMVVQMMASTPNDMVTNPMATSVSTISRKMAISPKITPANQQRADAPGVDVHFHVHVH